MRFLFLDLDTLRPDHLGCYGYHRETSPQIDVIAKEGTRFTNYYCSDAPCLPSRTALMSGQFGIHTGVVGHGGTAGDMRLEGASRDFTSRLNTESLPGFLRQQGMHTVSISPFAERHSSWTFYAGFNEMYNTGKCGHESAEDVTPVALDWIKRNAKKDNWFLHINYWDPHTPYRAPEEFGNPFEKEPIPEWLTEEVLQEHLKHVGPHSANEINMYDDHVPDQYQNRMPGAVKNMKDLHRFIDGYDCGIRYMDEHISRLVQALKDEDVYEDLVIVITADHGENLGELGLYAEHGTADNVTCRIPMIIRWPGKNENHVDQGLHYNLDLLPTLAELFDTEPCGKWDGESFAKVLEGEDLGRSELVISQCAHVCQRSVRFDDWIYMRTYHDGYHLFPKEMLYNVNIDPHEQNNVAGEYPDICYEGAHRLLNWHDDMMSTMDSDCDPLWTVMREGGPYHARGHLKDYCKWLKATGRGDAIEELRRRHPDEFK